MTLKKIYFLSLSILFFIPSTSSIAQNGCTDPQATNYDDIATVNDGSCIYSPTSYVLTELAELPSEIDESSGLVFFNQQLWTTNDAGNDSELYRIDTLTGAIQQTVAVAGAVNFDWEDLADDEDHIYIGDFGNNIGNRTNLRVFKVNKSELPNNIVNSEEIEFTFSDQVDFSPDNNNHNFDCEAFFYHNDSLYLFSKNWVDFKTRMYVLPTTPGTHEAVLRDSFNVNGLITGASINADGVVALLGYTTSEAFMWLLFDYDGDQFFSGNKRRISFGSILNSSQVEGITFSTGTRGYISAENFSVLAPRLHRFNTNEWTETVSTIDITNSQEIKLYPNPSQGKLTIDYGRIENEKVHVEFYNLVGQKVKEELLHRNASFLNLSVNNLIKGTYILQLKGEKQWYSAKVIRW